MAKFIDLDAVRQPVGTFRLGGKEYEVWPLKIEQTINLLVADTQDAANPDAPPSPEQFKNLVRGLKAAIPDCPEEILLQMDITQFNALSAWIRASGQEDDAPTKNPEPPAA